MLQLGTWYMIQLDKHAVRTIFEHMGSYTHMFDPSPRLRGDPSAETRLRACSLGLVAEDAMRQYQLD